MINSTPIFIFIALIFHLTSFVKAEINHINNYKTSVTHTDSLSQLNIPQRDPAALSGSEFMQKVENMTFEDREDEIYKEISSGNIPDFLRNLVTIETNFNDANGESHSVKYQVMPDYLAIGSDEDFCRIPMGPITAQKLADLFGAVLPTSKLVDNIYLNAEIKLAPVTYYPVENQNELVPKFIQHNTDIEQQRISEGGNLGQLVGGIKKDVVLSNKITDPSRENHVVIYGWHQLDGSPIQPLTNIHYDTYVDYSHGIRFMNSQFVLDGEIQEITNILSTPILYKILSNEYGIMTQPTYLTVEDLTPITPKSFAVFSESETSIKIIIDDNNEVDTFVVYLSKDGINFDTNLSTDSNIFIINNLEADTRYFIKITAENSYGSSPESEVLSAVTSGSNEPKILIVNGFDRTSSGNAFNFIRQHSESIWNNNYYYESATNDAVLAGMVNLEEYSAVDYILGDESTADETFSYLEQSSIKSYLQNGGNLFVSGSELAWDLDYKGSSTDKEFIWNFLKIKYIADAPNNSPQTYYQAEILVNSVFDVFSTIDFDDGSHGSIDVKWPDVIKGTKGGKSFLTYEGFDSSYGSAGIYYEGMFPSGTKSGKIVTMGFPFETIYKTETRNAFMGDILDFFSGLTDLDENDILTIPNKLNLYQNYPNPFNPVTTIKYTVASNVKGQMSKGETHIRLEVFDVLGRKVATLVNQEQKPGNYSVEFNSHSGEGLTGKTQSLSSGIYYYTLSSENFIQTRKMMLLK